MEKITYHCKEHHFQNEYDWIIYLNEESNNDEDNAENVQKNEESENNEQNEFEEQSIYNKNSNTNKRIISKINYKFKINN